MRPLRALTVLFGSSLILANTSWALTDVVGEERAFEPRGERLPGVFFAIPASFEHQFRTRIDDGGRFDVNRFTVGLAARTEVLDELDLTLRFTYNFDSYNFRGDTSLGRNPWGDIHTLNFVGILGFALDSDWTIFGGPALQFARESGASWGDSVIGGGFFGASYVVSDELTIGGGLGVVSQIEDDARLFPVLVLEWQITDLLRVSSETAASASGDIGAELIYDLGGGWEAAVGGASRFRRFRLDGSGPAPDGVGEERSIPMWGRVSYHFSRQATINAYVGGSLAGKLRLDDEDGRRIARDSYHAAPFIGISGSLRF